MSVDRAGGGCARLYLFALCGILFATHLSVAQEAIRRQVPPEAPAALLHADSVTAASQKEYVPEWYSMFTNIPRNWVRFANTTFTKEKVPAIVGMGVLTVGLVATDDETWRISDRWYKGSRDVQDISDLFEYMGDGRPQFGLAAAFAAYGFAASDRRALRTASQTVEAIFSCGIVIQTLKHLTGRESPFVSTAPGGIWIPFPNQIEYHKHVPQYDAYPSGHIATALATVTVVAENYPEWGWVRPIGYTIVALIGIAMGNTGIHWYSDYPLGLALGYSFGMLAAHPPEMGGIDAENMSGSPRVSLAPVVVPGGAGVSVMVSF